MVSSHVRLRYQLWIFNDRLQHNTNIQILMPVHQRTQTRSKPSIPNVAVLWYCFHQHTNATKENIGDAYNQKGTIMTNLFSCSQPEFLCPNSCKHKSARQIRMMDQETRLAPKGMLTSTGPRPTDKLGSRIATRDHIGFDRVRTPHCVSSVPFNVLRWLHLSMGSQNLPFASCRSSSTIEKTPSQHRNTVPMPLRQGVDNHPLAWRTKWSKGLLASMTHTLWTDRPADGCPPSWRSPWVPQDMMPVFVCVASVLSLNKTPTQKTQLIHSHSASPSLIMRISSARDANTLLFTLSDD